MEPINCDDSSQAQQTSRPPYFTAEVVTSLLLTLPRRGVNYSENKKFMLATAAPQSPYMEPDNLWADRGCWWVVGVYTRAVEYGDEGKVSVSGS